ncbi:hypothetical protein ACFO0M_17450, partial [Micromonospora mangrovi]
TCPTRRLDGPVVEMSLVKVSCPMRVRRVALTAYGPGPAGYEAVRPSDEGLSRVGIVMRIQAAVAL